MINDSMTVMQAVQQVGDEALVRQRAKVAFANLMTFEVEGIVVAAKGKHASEAASRPESPGGTELWLIQDKVVDRGPLRQRL